MNRDLQTIEQIVAEVVRRLSQLAEPPPAPAAAAAVARASQSVAKSSVASKPTVAADTLVLDARVVATATIHGRLKGIRRVVVGSRAVVTPSVKDELRKRNVRLEYQDTEAVSTGAGDLTVVRCTRGEDTVRAMATLPMPAAVIEQTCDDLPSAVASAAKAVERADQVSILVTDEILAAVCLLNRSSHVRAAHACTIDQTRRAIGAIGTNVLVVDPRELTSNQWSVVVKVFRQNLPRGCPPLL